MKIPFRLEIIRRLSDRLKTVSPENGFQSDLSDDPVSGVKRVKRGVLFLGDDDPDMVVSILEPPVAIEQLRNQADNTERAGEWDVLIQGWARDKAPFEPCDLAYILVADVQQALTDETKQRQKGTRGFPDILGFQGKIDKMRIGAPVVRPSEDVTGFGVFYLILTFEIVEDMAKPFGYIANQQNGD